MGVVINRQGHSVKIPLPFPATSVWWADPDRARHISLGPIISLFLYFSLSPYLLLSLCYMLNSANIFEPLLSAVLELETHPLNKACIVSTRIRHYQCALKEMYLER